jgi:ribonuclease HI
MVQKDWIAELMGRYTFEQDPHEPGCQIDHEKMIHVVTDCGANPNPGSAGWGAVIRQSGRFTMMWQYFDHATSNTMELRAATEALRYVPANMAVHVQTVYRDGCHLYLKGLKLTRNARATEAMSSLNSKVVCGRVWKPNRTLCKWNLAQVTR